jgi:hypothetical protein
MKKKNTLMLALFIALTFALFGQDISTSRIYSAQGNDFVILRDGKRILYNADRLNDGSVAFMQGDIFQTGQQSSADIQFGQDGPLLKIVENSSIGFVGYASGVKALSLNLFYGRIRVKNDAGDPSIQVSSRNGLVDITQGDTGIDYIVRNDLLTLQSEASISSPVLYVTNFAGKTNVFPANDGSAISTLPELLVREGETVSVEFVSSLSYVERNALDSSMANYWQVYDFAPIPVANSAISEVPSAEVSDVLPGADSSDMAASTENVPPDNAVISTNVEEMPYTVPDMRPEYEALLKKKNNAMIAGLVFLAGGLALGGVGLYHQYAGNTDTGYYFSLSGLVISGLSAASFIHGITINLDE